MHGICLLALLPILSPAVQAQAPARVIELRISTVGNPEAVVRVREGSRATLRIDARPVLYLEPVVADGGLDIKVREGAVNPDDERWPAEPQHNRVTPGQPIDIRTEHYTLRVTGEALGESSVDGARGPCTICCVVCDAVVTCGCRVETRCGECSCPGCVTGLRNILDALVRSGAAGGRRPDGEAR